MSLSAALQKALAEANYKTPTPIQKAAIPPALEGKDILGCAQTGTGKTAAFSLPILERIDQTATREPRVRALILTPTRELAAQIGESIETYGKHLDLYHSVIFGGVNDKPQIKALKEGVDILVATPGRLLDLMNRGFVSLRHIEVFVLDEADRMLDMGFIHDVRKVTAALPQKRQTLFFSATMPDEIRNLAASLLRDPVHVSVAPVSSTAEKVEQTVYFVEKKDKPQLLIDKLRGPGSERTIVFTRTKHGANRIAATLAKAKIEAAAIHGNKSQGARTRALEGFRSGDLQVLVATDIAARGIDIDGISLVINYDIPNIPETYVHRIGRTARAGRSGQAASFCQEDERYFFEDIEKLTKQNIPRNTQHAYPSEFPLPPETDLVGRRYFATKPKLQQGRPQRPAGGRPGGGQRNAAPRDAGPRSAAPRESSSSSNRSAQHGGRTQTASASHPGRPQTAASHRGASEAGRPRKPGGGTGGRPSGGRRPAPAARG